MDEAVPESIVARVSEVFTEEALRAQDGKKVPLTLGFGGPIIGESILKYDEDAGALVSELHVADPKLAELLKGPLPPIFSEGE